MARVAIIKRKNIKVNGLANTRESLTNTNVAPQARVVNTKPS